MSRKGVLLGGGCSGRDSDGIKSSRRAASSLAQSRNARNNDVKQRIYLFDKQLIEAWLRYADSLWYYI